MWINKDLVVASATGLKSVVAVLLNHVKTKELQTF